MEKQQSHIEQLANYFKKNIKKGYTEEALKISLVKQGYSNISIEKALDLANKQLAEELPLMKEKPEIIYKIEPEISILNKNFLQKFIDWLFGL